MIATGGVEYDQTVVDGILKALKLPAELVELDVRMKLGVGYEVTARYPAPSEGADEVVVRYRAVKDEPK